MFCCWFFFCFGFFVVFTNPLHEVLNISVSSGVSNGIPDFQVEGRMTSLNIMSNGCVGFFVLSDRDISLEMKMLIFGLYHNFPILCKLFMMGFLNFFFFFFLLAGVCERVRLMKFHFVLPKTVNNYLFVYKDRHLSIGVLIHLVRSSFLYIYFKKLIIGNKL